MQIVRHDSRYLASRVTGPRHNFLSMQFGQACGVVVEPLDEDRPANIELALSAVTAHVTNGVDKANIALGTEYRVSEIRFLRSDSSPASVYESMAYEITLFMHRESSGE